MYPNIEGEGATVNGVEASMPRTHDLEGELQGCLACGTDLTGSDLFKTLAVCPECGYHYSISARARIKTLVDEGTFVETHRFISSIDPLEFTPRIAYQVRVVDDQDRTGLSEAALTGECSVGDTRCAIVAIDFGFLGGSMGLVVGEKVARLLEQAAVDRLPVLVFASTGGTRVQEGVFSLMQMAKTVAAARSLRAKGVPLIAVFGNPSTGQVVSSFGAVADVRIGEPGAHVGFGSLGVLQEIEGDDDLGSQTNSEAMLDRGNLDMVVNRSDQRDEIAKLLRIFADRRNEPLPARRRIEPYHGRRLNAWDSVVLSRRADRPRASDYIAKVFRHFVELHGDRTGSDDPNIVVGLGYVGVYPVMVVGQQRREEERSNEGEERVASFVDHYGNAELERGGLGVSGFRKARRAFKIASDFGFPLVTLIDTPGPRLGVDQELLGIAGEIAETMDMMLGLETPVISVVIGEGGAEAALAFGVSDRLLMLENAIYTTISPESGAELELRDRTRAPELAKSLRLGAFDAMEFGIADRIIREPEGGANANPHAAALLLRQALISEIGALRHRHRRVLVRRRRARFRQFGQYGPVARAAVRSELTHWRTSLKRRVRKVFRSSEDPQSELSQNKNRRHQ